MGKQLKDFNRRNLKIIYTELYFYVFSQFLQLHMTTHKKAEGNFRTDCVGCWAGHTGGIYIHILRRHSAQLITVRR